MTYIEFNIEDAPEWVKEDKRTLTNSVLVDGAGETVLSQTSLVLVAREEDLDDFVEMIFHLSMTHMLQSYEFDFKMNRTKLTLLPSLDGNTNIEAEMISNLVNAIFCKRI